VLPIVATVDGLALQVPPDGVTPNAVVDAAHNIVVPDMALGNAFTVIVVVAIHPVELTVYVIVVVPTDAPVTRPDVTPTFAIVRSLLVQVPTPVASLSALEVVTHKLVLPVIAAGSGLTVTSIVE
jgi:hypothetical protein